MKREFNIGDEVWTLLHRTQETKVTCPDCCGNKYLTVIMGDGSQETIECSRCSRGYNDPVGFLIDSSPDWLPIRSPINRKEQKLDGTVEYGCGDYYATTHVYETKEEAERAREEEIASRKAQYQAQLRNKEPGKHSWAWNVRYHREQIRDLAKRIEYHQAKLDVAKLKSKEKTNE